MYSLFTLQYIPNLCLWEYKNVAGFLNSVWINKDTKAGYRMGIKILFT